MALAGQTELSTLLARKVSITTPRIKSGSANPAPSLTHLRGHLQRGELALTDQHGDVACGP